MKKISPRVKISSLKKQKNNKPKLLIVAKTVPLFDRASGDFRLWQILQILSKSFEIDYLCTSRPAMHLASGQLGYPMRGAVPLGVEFNYLDQPYIDALERCGIHYLQDKEPLALRSEKVFDIIPYLKDKKYDGVWIEFYYLARDYILDIRKTQPSTKIIIDSVDLHFSREQMEYDHLCAATYQLDALGNRKELNKEWHDNLEIIRKRVRKTRFEELSTYRMADMVVTVSANDSLQLKEAGLAIPQFFLPNIYPPIPQRSQSPSFQNRNGIVFVGNFDHNPNLSAAITIQQELAPRLRKRLGKIPIYIVGSNPPPRVQAMAKHGPCADQIIVTGYVPEIAEYLDKARVSIAPINYGAGMNGKIAEAMLYGLPVVTSELGAVGMQLKHEEHCLVAKNTDEFIEQIARLHEKENIWDFYREEGKKFVEKNLGSATIEKSIQKNFLPLFREPTKPLTRQPLKVVLITYNQWAYTKICLDSLAVAWKKLAPKDRPEVIVIDNNSQDTTRKELKKYSWVKLIANKTNLGFSKTCNQAMQLFPDSDLLYLNNDTIVPENFLTDLIAARLLTKGKAILTVYCPTEPQQEIDFVQYHSHEEFLTVSKNLASIMRHKLKPLQRASGTVLFLPLEVRNSVGEFDAGYGMGYFEDDDYCMRADKAGFSIQLVQSILVHHFGSATFGHGSQSKVQSFQQGFDYFILKWGKAGDDFLRATKRDS